MEQVKMQFTCPACGAVDDFSEIETDVTLWDTVQSVTKVKEDDGKVDFDADYESSEPSRGNVSYQCNNCHSDIEAGSLAKLERMGILTEVK